MLVWRYDLVVPCKITFWHNLLNEGTHPWGSFAMGLFVQGGHNVQLKEVQTRQKWLRKLPYKVVQANLRVSRFLACM